MPFHVATCGCSWLASSNFARPIQKNACIKLYNYSTVPHSSLLSLPPPSYLLSFSSSASILPTLLLLPSTSPLHFPSIFPSLPYLLSLFSPHSSLPNSPTTVRGGCWEELSTKTLWTKQSTLRSEHTIYIFNAARSTQHQLSTPLHMTILPDLSFIILQATKALSPGNEATYICIFYLYMLHAIWELAQSQDCLRILRLCSNLEIVHPI